MEKQEISPCLIAMATDPRFLLTLISNKKKEISRCSLRQNLFLTLNQFTLQKKDALKFAFITPVFFKILSRNPSARI